MTDPGLEPDLAYNLLLDIEEAQALGLSWTDPGLSVSLSLPRVTRSANW